MALNQIRSNLFRRKQIDAQNIVSKLDRCLTTFDLTALGKYSVFFLPLHVMILEQRLKS